MNSGLFRASLSALTTVLCSKDTTHARQGVFPASARPLPSGRHSSSVLPPPRRHPPATSPALSTCTQRTRDTQPARFPILSGGLQVARLGAEVAADFIGSGFCPSYSGCSHTAQGLTPESVLPGPQAWGASKTQQHPSQKHVEVRSRPLTCKLVSNAKVGVALQTC